MFSVVVVVVSSTLGRDDAGKDSWLRASEKIKTRTSTHIVNGCHQQQDDGGDVKEDDSSQY